MIDFDEVNKNIENLPCNVERRQRNELTAKILEFFSNLNPRTYYFDGRRQIIHKRHYILKVVKSNNPLITTQIEYWDDVGGWHILGNDTLKNIQWVWDNREQIIRELERNCH